MKILQKSSQATYDKYTKSWWEASYIDAIWDIQLKQTFEELGHQVSFIGETPVNDKIITDHGGYDLLLFHEIPSFSNTQEYSLRLLKEFKGIKVFYIPTYIANDYQEIIEQFDYICVADSGYNVERWKLAYPNKKIIATGWHSSREELLDLDSSNPYTDDNFKTVYFGIIIKRYLELFKALANDGEHIYIGGYYYNDETKLFGGFTDEEISQFPPNLHVVFNGGFKCGEQFRYIANANLGLTLTESKHIGSMRHKVSEYLCCGTRTLVEETIANGHKVLDLHAGFVFPYDNYKIIYEMIQNEKANPYNKEELKTSARKVFDMKLVCSQILDGAK